MGTFVFPAMAALVFFALLFFVARLAHGLVDILAFFVFTISVFYGLRVAFLVLGLDTPYPDALFTTGDNAWVFTKTVLLLSLYLAAVAIAVIAVLRRPGAGRTMLFASRRPDPRRLKTAVVVLTSLAAVISFIMLARFGGVSGMITASKINKTLAGLNFLRVPAAIGAFVSVAAFLDGRGARHRARAALSQPVYLACAVSNGFFVFIWGARSTLVLVGVVLLVGLSVSVGPIARRSAAATVARGVIAVLLAAVVVGGVSFGLRVVRDDAISGQLEPGLASSTPARKVSLATNSVYFDASLLAVRDWPTARPYRNGEDFRLGLDGVVPRIVWSGKPQVVVVGRWFRQVYQPKRVNGWPVGAPTVWYLNFGPFGVLLGGLLSGLVLGLLSRAQRAAATTGINVVVSAISAVFVMPLGLSGETLQNAAFWWVLLTATVWYVTPRRPKASPTGSAAPSPSLRARTPRVFEGAAAPGLPQASAHRGPE